jgi:magnesium chelatase family protein
MEAADEGLNLADVRGQALPRRALTVAAAGWHNLLMVGPPGSGKTTLARCLPGILPRPENGEALEMARIASVAGTPLVARRPFRSPHHTASSAAIVGGGTRPRPGEITLAHHGVLFLDEFPEFSRSALEALREPLERDEVVIARASGSVSFPARVLLVAAMNPTRRGNGRVGSDGSLQRLSGPLLDRIDLQVEVPPVPADELDGERTAEASGDVAAIVASAWRFQRLRQGSVPNGRLGSRQLDDYAPMSDNARALLRRAVEELGLSARAWDRLRRVSRTLADLEEHPEIESRHIAESIQYRWLDRAL